MGAMITVLYFLPFWFQAVESVSAVESGIRTLPLVLSLVLGSVFAGMMVSRFGWYNPFLYACSGLTAIGAGLLMTLKPDSGEGLWLGYQLLFGLGLGMGLQQSVVAVQASLPKKDVAVGISVVLVGLNLGGAVLSCVAQTLFNHDLGKGLSAIPGVDPLMVSSAGPTNLRSILPVELLPVVLQAYNHALSRTFIVALAAASLSLPVGFGVPWINVKGVH